LPANLEKGLSLLERGYALTYGGSLAESRLPGKLLDFFNRLNEGKVDWILVGAEALNLYRNRPRATVDIDLVVRKKHLRTIKSTETCKDVEDTEVHFKAVLSEEPNRLEVDVIKSQSHELVDLALDNQNLIQGVPVPRIEALLALKYLAAVSPWRERADQYLDLSDFIHAFKDNQQRIDRQFLIDLASRAHANGPDEFPRFLTAVENDEPITL
jgi:hypothetical protein